MKVGNQYVSDQFTFHLECLLHSMPACRRLSKVGNGETCKLHNDALIMNRAEALVSIHPVLVASLLAKRHTSPMKRRTTVHPRYAWPMSGIVNPSVIVFCVVLLMDESQNLIVLVTLASIFSTRSAVKLGDSRVSSRRT